MDFLPCLSEQIIWFQMCQGIFCTEVFKTLFLPALLGFTKPHWTASPQSTGTVSPRPRAICLAVPCASCLACRAKKLPFFFEP